MSSSRANPVLSAWIKYSILLPWLGVLSSPSPKSSPLRPKPDPKPVKNQNPSPIGTGADSIITGATTPPPHHPTHNF